MNKYKVATSKISCRVETDKLEKLKNQLGMTNSELFDYLLEKEFSSEKVSDSFCNDKEISLTYLFPVKEKGVTSFQSSTLKSCYGDLVLICNMIKDYCSILQKDVDSQNVSGSVAYNFRYYIDRFLNIFDSFSKQLNYDYDSALRKCRMSSQQDSNNDVGEDALILFSKRGKKIV